MRHVHITCTEDDNDEEHEDAKADIIDKVI